MKNNTFDTSLNRMKELMNKDTGSALKPNISETVEYKIQAADGKTYGIVREYQRYFIKEEASNGSFEYIGGIGNKSENEYPSFNSALRNIELKVRSINEAKNSDVLVESFKPAPQAEYIIEATETMRTELDRVKQVMSGANKIMNETKTEFITKPIFKDPEGFGYVSDPKKQGEPFEDKTVEVELNRDNSKSTKTAKNAGTPFEGEVKPAPEKMDIETTNEKPSEAGKFGEPAKNVPANSVANQKPTGGKVVRVTEAQLQEAKRLMKEWGEEEFFMGDDSDGNFGDDAYGENPLLKQFDYPEINKLGRGVAPIPATKPGEDLEIDLGSDIPDEDFQEEPLEMEENYEINEGFMDSMKAVGSVGKYFGNKAVKGAQNVGNKIAQTAKNVGSSVAQAGQEVSQQYNKSMANSSADQVKKIANNLRNEIINMNQRITKAGGKPMSMASIMSILSNQLRGAKDINTNAFKMESREAMINEITEAVLKAFGDHPTYQKPAFTTPKANQEMLPGTHEWDDQSVKGEAPYGEKIGSSAPYTLAVNQKVGEGEIGADGDEIIKGKTPQGLPTQGKKGDVSPFNKEVKNTGDKIAKGTPVQNGETQQGEPKLGMKGDTKPFEKKVTTESKKEEALRKLTESIIRDLKKK